jgi:hypothetical protein
MAKRKTGGHTRIHLANYSEEKNKVDKCPQKVINKLTFICLAMTRTGFIPQPQSASAWSGLGSPINVKIFSLHFTRCVRKQMRRAT